MMRWLFDVKRYTPVKSTPDRANGTPAVQWEKVLTYPPEAQARFTPATDTQTLEILAAQHSDETIRLLLKLNAVGNICKSFLKPAEVEDDGTVTEKGLHYWIASDDCIHGNTSTTETGRNRSCLVSNTYDSSISEKSGMQTALIAGRVA